MGLVRALLGLEGLEQRESLADEGVQVLERGLLAGGGGKLYAREAGQVGLDGLGGVLHLEGERELVLDETGAGELGVGVEALGLGVCSGLGEDVLEGLEAVGEGGDGDVVEE